MNKPALLLTLALGAGRPAFSQTARIVTLSDAVSAVLARSPDLASAVGAPIAALSSRSSRSRSESASSGRWRARASASDAFSAARSVSLPSLRLASTCARSSCAADTRRAAASACARSARQRA